MAETELAIVETEATKLIAVERLALLDATAPTETTGAIPVERTAEADAVPNTDAASSAEVEVRVAVPPVLDKAVATSLILVTTEPLKTTTD